MNSSMILILTVVVLIVVALVSFFIKNLKKMEKEVVADLQDTQAKGENVYTIPEEYNNVSLGVSSGIKFGIGFGIGLFFAGLLITVIFTVFFGLTVPMMISSILK